MIARSAAVVPLLVLAALTGASSLGAQAADAAAAIGADTNVVRDSLDGAGADTLQRSGLGRAWDFSRDAVGSRLTGEAVTMGELYLHRGAAARRPGQSWRVQYAPQLALAGGVSLSADLLLSSEGNELRQNINQAGFTPRWGWGAAYLGDFTRPYTSYTTQGLRVRGGGLDLTPGPVRASLQVGRTQRAVSSIATGPVFQRNMVAGRLGIGQEGGRFLDLTILKAKDDVNSVERTLVVVDTLVLDTLVTDPVLDSLRPRLNTFNRPQENLVLSLAAQLPLFARSLVLRGEVARAAITRDLMSPQANPDGLSGPARAVARHVMPIHLSTADDGAYTVEATFSRGAVNLQGAYEEVGAGYTSLGLGYLINDRRAYRLGGGVRLLDSRTALQGQYQHQNDNLVGQLASTTSRDALSATAAIRVSPGITTTLAAVTNFVSNPAPVDTFVVDNRALALSATTMIAHPLLGRTAATAVTYSLQQTSDGNVVRAIPGVTVHSASLLLQFPLAPRITLSPSLSAVLTRIEDQADQRNLFAGFRGQGRLLDGRLHASGDISQTFTGGRRVFAVRSQASYPLGSDTRLMLQTRHTSYSAFASRPAFRESFITTTLARSF